MSKENKQSEESWSDFNRVFLAMSAAVYVAHITAEGDAFSVWEERAIKDFSEQPLVHYWTIEEPVVFQQVLGTIFMFACVYLLLRGVYTLLRGLILAIPFSTLMKRTSKALKCIARRFLDFLSK